MKNYLSKKILTNLMAKAILAFGTLALSSCAGMQAAIDAAAEDTNGTAATESISAEDGGSITSSDGKMTLTVPAGALDADTEITITPVQTDNGIAYDFQPDGLVFNTPARATMEVDMSGQTPVDENGDPLDGATTIPDAILFLVNDDGSVEILENVAVETDDSGTVMVSADIPHFTSLISSVGNSFYVYMTSLGTHYVGSDFKADITVRYLGYSHTSSYRNMSIAYTVRGVTVTKIKIEDSGAIERVTPEEITRSDYLNTRGEESATRPKFNCNEVGDGTITVTVSVEGVVEYTFQPENRTYVRTVNMAETTSRKGKCIARVGDARNYYNDGGAAEAMYAVNDAVGDVLTDYDGTLVPALELDQAFPAHVDTTAMYVGVVGGELLNANLVMDGNVPAMSPEDAAALCFHLLILDPSVGDTGFAPYRDGLWDLSISADENGEYAASASFWNGDFFEPQDDVPVDLVIDQNVVILVTPLSALGINADEVEGLDFRGVAETIVMDGAGEAHLVDVLGAAI